MEEYSCNLILEAFNKFLRENQNLFKIVQKYWALCTYISNRSTQCSAARPQCTMKTLLLFHDKSFNTFILLTGTYRQTKLREGIVALPLQQLLRNPPEVAVYVQCLSCALLTVNRNCNRTYATSFILRLREIYCPDVTRLNTCGSRDRRRNFCSRIFQRSEMLPTKY